MRFHIQKTGVVLTLVVLFGVWAAPAAAWYGHHRGHGYHGRHDHGYKRYHRHRHHCRPYHHYRYKHYRKHHHYRHRYRHRHHGLHFNFHFDGYRPYRHHRYYPRYAPRHEDRYRHHSDYSGGTQTPVYVKPLPDYHTQLSRAWKTLKAGRGSEAASRFEHLTRAYPGRVEPEIGQALALAEAGRLEQGRDAMRRALATDPGMLARLEFDNLMQLKLSKWIGNYEQAAILRNGSDDQRFMLAALNYLKRDYLAARDHLDRLENGSGDAASTRNLRRLVDEALPQQDVAAQTPLTESDILTY